MPKNISRVETVKCFTVKSQAVEGYNRVQTPDEVHRIWEDYLSKFDEYDPEVEQLMALYTNARSYILRAQILTRGLVSSSLADCRSVFRVAMAVNATHVVVLHNHPTGCTSPSHQDIRLTSSLIQAGSLLDVDLLDHVIVGGDGYLSMREAFTHLWNKADTPGSDKLAAEKFRHV
jgi:DNA repair protein RadC